MVFGNLIILLLGILLGPSRPSRSTCDRLALFFREFLQARGPASKATSAGNFLTALFGKTFGTPFAAFRSAGKPTKAAEHPRHLADLFRCKVLGF